MGTFSSTIATGGRTVVTSCRERTGRRDPLRWPDLLSEYRVILLSEAGSGKTEEIRNVARRLRQDGKSAFFVRIEHVTQDFEDAFEEGSLEEFRACAASGEEGWPAPGFRR